MEKIQLQIDSLEYEEKYHNIWGNICFKFGDRYFPDENWTDLISGVFSMWANELMAFLQGNKSNAILRFMDGPFFVHISTEKNGHLLLSCQNYKHEEFQVIVSQACFITEIINTVQKFLLECDKLQPEFQNTYDYRQIKALIQQEAIS